MLTPGAVGQHFSLDCLHSENLIFFSKVTISLTTLLFYSVGDLSNFVKYTYSAMLKQNFVSTEECVSAKYFEFAQK